MKNEIEHKYLISMPDRNELTEKDGCKVWDIEQIYLTADPELTRRIRRVVCDGVTTCYKTFKHRLNDLSCIEDEGIIPEQEYLGYKQEADPELKPILKTRYRIPYKDQLLEIDIYPFWTDRAVLEIEVDSEEEPVFIPDWIHVLKEVTSDRRYKNHFLAREIPYDEFG